MRRSPPRDRVVESSSWPRREPIDRERASERSWRLIRWRAAPMEEAAGSGAGRGAGRCSARRRACCGPRSSGSPASWRGSRGTTRGGWRTRSRSAWRSRWCPCSTTSGRSSTTGGSPPCGPCSPPSSSWSTPSVRVYIRTSCGTAGVAHHHIISLYVPRVAYKYMHATRSPCSVQATSYAC